MKRIFYLFAIIFVLSCSKDKDLHIPGTVNPDPKAGVDVQDFMWKAMNFWYFWQEDVPNLADDKFINTPEGIEAYTAFLDSENNPGAFFDNKLLFSGDRFSYFNKDYSVLTQSLAGVSRSNGLEFGLVRFQDSETVFGYVRYIVSGSDAASKDIERGELFTGVDGVALTASNFGQLLFGENNTYTLDMAEFIGGELATNGKEVTLTKEQALSENPIFISKTFEISGEKIGYLMYNQFTNEYDAELYSAIQTLKSAGIAHLVLDLRYNPGGSVNTTRLLASMIYGTDTSDLFLTKRYNDKLQPQFSADRLEVYFADKVGRTDINSLGLNKLYVLTTASSASASELLMNSLEPYMDIIHIGETTRGKNEFSSTLVDDRDNSYLYTPSRVNKINPKVQWAIQPLLGRNENADGFSDYTSGLIPDVTLEEDVTNLGILGDQNEPLLARAIQEITGSTGKRDFTVLVPADIISSSKAFSPIGERMVDDTHY